METILESDQYLVQIDDLYHVIIARIKPGDSPGVETIIEITRRISSLLGEYKFTSHSPAHLIIDASAVMTLPLRISEINRVAEFFCDSRIHSLMFVVAPGFIGKAMEFMARVVSRVSNKRFHVFSLIDDALTFLGIPVDSVFQLPNVGLKHEPIPQSQPVVW